MTTELLNQLIANITSAFHKINLKVPPDVIESVKQQFENNKLMALFDPKDGIQDTISNIQHKKIVLEIATQNKHYAGYDKEQLASGLSRRYEYPIYQIIFEDTQQKLIFEFIGDDHEKLKKELEKIYPGCPIEQSHDDYTIGEKGYANYREASNEFDKMQEQLDKIDHKLAMYCIKKKLNEIDGTDRKATRMRLQNMDRISDMVFGHITININNIQINNIINNNYDNKQSREDVHRTWIENNPVHDGEFAKAYYDRLKLNLPNALGVVNHTKILRNIGYTRIVDKLGSRWSLEK